MIALFGFVASDDFCQTFKRHGNRISYIYKQGQRKGTKSTDESIHHIIIDGKYWDLEFDSVKHTVGFDRTKSHLAPHFTDQYIGTACVWEGSKEEGGCRTYLFPKNDTHKQVNETSIANNIFDRVRNLNEYSEPVTRQVLNMRSDNYEFVNSANKYNWHPEVELAIGSDKRFNRLVISYQSLPDFTIFTTVNQEDPKNGSHFDHNREVIGISNQYSEQKKGLGYLLLIKEGDEVFWCWQFIDNHNVGMKL